MRSGKQANRSRPHSDFEPLDAQKETQEKSHARRRHKSVGLSPMEAAILFCLAVLVALGFAGPLLAPQDPTAAQLGGRLSEASVAHPLGTDHLGRDVLSRLLTGARLSLGLTAGIVAFSGVFGVGLGVLAGRSGGVISSVMNRTVDTLTALPAIFIGLTLVAIFEPGVVTLFAAITLVGWMPFARLAYGLTLKLGSRGYVEAATVTGAGEGRIVLHHILPNAAGPLISLAGLQFAYTLLSISGFSFLGLGAQPPTAEWGVMLSEGRPYLADRPLLVLAPAVAVVASALTVTASGRALARRWEIHE